MAEAKAREKAAEEEALALERARLAGAKARKEAAEAKLHAEEAARQAEEDKAVAARMAAGAPGTPEEKSRVLKVFSRLDEDHLFFYAASCVEVLESNELSVMLREVGLPHKRVVQLFEEAGVCVWACVRVGVCACVRV